MTDKKFRFTDDRLRKLSSDGKRLMVYDTKQPGLALRVTIAGTKTFCFSAWDPKRRRSVDVTIGTYPKVTLTKARNEALQYTNDIEDGVDIVGLSQEERNEPTLDEAFKRWVTKKAAKGKTSWKIDEQRYNKHISPRFGGRRVGDISGKQVESWFLSLPQKTGLSTTSANRLLVIIKTVYNQELRKYENPCDGISLNREESRERFLKPGELPLFFEALDDLSTPDYLRDFVYLGLYTGARKANLLGMRWSDIDFDMESWTIPAAKSKNRSSMTLPIIPAAIEILARRWQENQERPTPSTFVFPSLSPRSKTGHLHDIRDSWESMLKRADVADFRMHDLRRSLGSWQTITGSSTAVVGKALGHKSQQATAVYARMHLDPIRQSIEKAVEAMHQAESKVACLGSQREVSVLSLRALYQSRVGSLRSPLHGELRCHPALCGRFAGRWEPSICAAGRH